MKLKKENEELNILLEIERNNMVGCLSNLRELRKREFGNSPDKINKFYFINIFNLGVKSILLITSCVNGKNK